MESDLLEISGEDDDSLLLQNHQALNDDVSTSNTYRFSCSPLHFPRSDPPGQRAKNLSLSSIVDKENIINNAVNKSELTKLSLEPQQMKRKKKAGGYNLRKSLAWDRAFFTEEGVLNSTELSLISGNFGKLSGEKLLAIEEETEPLSSDSQDLQALENNLFNKLPLNNRSKKEEKKIGSSLLQKSSASASHSVVKQNVLPVHDVNRSGSKRSGCPRPVMSSALKRPANVSSTKAAVKEPKISKIPAPKPVSSVLSITAKSAPKINKPKPNQGAQAAVNSHRSIGLTVSKKSTRSTQNDGKSIVSSRSQITKSSTQQAKRCVGSLALKSHSSTYSHHQLVTKADNGLKVNQDTVVAVGHGSINHGAGSSKITSFPQSGYHIHRSTQYEQAQLAKPSGLRMPSPSLGFFTQSKTNASHNLQSSTQSCNKPKSNIPNLRKLGVLNSICESPAPSVKVDVVANDVAAITNARMSSTEPSVPSSANSLCENIKPNSRGSKMLRLEVKVPCNSNNHELANNQQTLLTNDNDLNQQIENVGLQYTDDKLLLQNQSSKQVKLDHKRRADLVIPRSPDQNGHEFKDTCFLSHHSLQIEAASKADNVGNQVSRNEQHNSLEDFDLFPQLHYSDVDGCNVHGSPKVNNDQISIHDGHEQSSKQAEQAEPCIFDDQIINEIERPHINEGTLLQEGEPSEEFLSFNSVHSKDICPEVRDCSASELERTDGLPQYGGRSQGKDGADGADDLNLQSHVGDEQMHATKGNLSLECCSCLPNASEAGNHHTLFNDVNKKPVEQPPLLNPGIIAETVFQDNCGSYSTDCLLRGDIFSSERLHAEINLQNVKDVASEIAEACQSEMAKSSAPCWIPPALHNCIHEMAEVVECQHIENEVPVTRCNHDIALLCEATSKGSERIREDQVTGAITACDISVSNDCQSGGDLNGSEMDNSHLISHHSPLVQSKGYSDVDDIIDLKSIEGNQYCLSAKCNSSIAEPGEKITSCHVDVPAMLTNSSVDKQNSSEKSIVQAEVIQSSEAGKAFQVNQIPEACLGLLSMEGNYFDSDNCADVSPRDKSFVRQAVEGPSDLYQVEHADEPNEMCAAGANEMTMRSSGKDAHLQFFNDGISFDSCKSNLFASAESNNFAVVEDLNEPCELQNIVIVEPTISDKFGLSINKEISSYVKIKQSDNNHDCYNDMIKPTSLNFELSSLSEDQISGAGNTCKSQAFGSLNEESASSIKTNPTSSRGNVLLEEVKRLENDVPQELNSAMIPVEANGGTTSFEKTGDDKKQNAPVVKPPPNVVPFSDEWLAAIEAAGEEILTMKSGAVQNSPKDKAIPEPGPWSPLLIKVWSIGIFHVEGMLIHFNWCFSYLFNDICAIVSVINYSHVLGPNIFTCNAQLMPKN
ncbi:uncharacterized protein LOC111301222 isoform X2 [Durio zibethinus]|uniref:Uncharacterized protein LOC111301222 isoform X2 n=1 Tax=Durio zibethinus TaxID=66656 RepID=A0A6P5ZIB6_DURZI|nr:uncharacterized protein LOC111301222 isoform X2 [Durio zibethinus]